MYILGYYFTTKTFDIILPNISVNKALNFSDASITNNQQSFFTYLQTMILHKFVDT